MRNSWTWLALVTVVCCCGCGNEVIEVAANNPAAGVPAAVPAAPAVPAAAAPAGAAPVPVASAAAPQPVAPQPSPQAGRLPDVPPAFANDPDEKGPDAFGPTGPPPAKREEAKAGAGVQGRGYGGGVVTEPIHQKFTIAQRIVFDIQIPKAMQLYKAMHDNKAPQTHEAFMKEIIKASSIVLPELPEGDKYVYDPALETLMVQHPE